MYFRDNAFSSFEDVGFVPLHLLLERLFYGQHEGDRGCRFSPFIERL
jgi:hypothetical protein